MLELLERLERLESRIDVIETDDIADIDAIVVEVIDEAAAIRARIGRPAQRVLYESRLTAALRQLPELFHAQHVSLRTGVRIELEAPDELLGDAATRPFRDHRRASANFGAGSEVGAGLAVLLDSHIAQSNARDGAVVVEQRLSG